MVRFSSNLTNMIRGKEHSSFWPLSRELTVSGYMGSDVFRRSQMTCGKFDPISTVINTTKKGIRHSPDDPNHDSHGLVNGTTNKLVKATRDLLKLIKDQVHLALIRLGHSPTKPFFKHVVSNLTHHRC